MASEPVLDGRADGCMGVPPGLLEQTQVVLSKRGASFCGTRIHRDLTDRAAMDGVGAGKKFMPAPLRDL